MLQHKVFIYPAIIDDIPSIIYLISSVNGDLDDISSDQFVIAEVDGKTVGCGRLKNFSYFDELASIAVDVNYRGVDIGSKIVSHLIGSTNNPVYLIAADKNILFFEKLGFILVKECPRELKPKMEKFPDSINVMGFWK